MHPLIERGERLEAEGRAILQARDVSDELETTYHDFLNALRKQLLADSAIDGGVSPSARRLIDKQTDALSRRQLFDLLKRKSEADRLAYIRSMIQLLLASESAPVG